MLLVSLEEQLRRRFGRSHAIETAESGEAALELLEELEAEHIAVPVVLRDPIMPGMKGDQPPAHIEARRPEIMKIMLTGYASVEAVGSAVNRANLFRYLSKPWAEADLAMTVKSAIDVFEARERMKEQQGTLVELNELALELTASLASQDRYQRLVARMARALRVPRVALFGARRGTLRRLAVPGPGRDGLPRLPLPPPEGFPGVALESEQIVRSAASPAGHGMADEVGWGGSQTGVVAMALRAEGEVTGLLLLGTEGSVEEQSDERVRGFAGLTAASLRTTGLIDALELASERQRQLASVLIRQADTRSAGPMQGSSPAIQTTLAALARVAGEEAPYLLLGAMGTGHEAAARHVHRMSARADGPFLTVHAAAIQQPSALGPRDSDGMPWIAHGGTLHIAGVDRLTSAAQLELVRTLRRSGEPDAPSVRIALSTTSGDEQGLRAALEPALLERLKLRVALPALRDRVDDIPVLARFYLRAHASRAGRRVEELPPNADAMLMAYPWPGNTEELERVMERAVLTASGNVVSIERAMLESAQTLGSYRLVERIGAGGMGEVWRAEHAHLRRPAAVKLIHSTSSKSAQEQANERFRREAGATARLRSPHTVELYDFGVNEAGDLYYVMEHLDGVDLHTLVAQSGPLAAERVVYLLIQACHSLMEAHEAGLVHRDIKPANLFVCRYGPDHDFLKVLDFGMVRGGGDPTVTEPGAVPGTPATLSPEQLRGTVDQRSDLYALGCTAFYLLTGRHVFTSRVPALLMDHVSTPPLPPSTVTHNPIPAELEALVLILLAKDPAQRYQSARELRAALQALRLPEPWTQERAAAWWSTPLAERPRVPVVSATDRTTR